MAALETIGLTVRMDDYVALEELNLTVNEGSFVAVVGPNGAGKSTLLKAILGLLPLADGEIHVFGQPADKARPGSVGYVPQFKTLDRAFPAVTCELVASGLRQSWPAVMRRREHERVLEALSLVGAAHLCHRPLGWLSGGELQRVYLARAIIRKPRLLLLDEPVTGIDMLGEDDMYSLLESYLTQREVTVLMVTHDWLAARHHATHALLLNRRLIAYGPPEQTLCDSCLRELFGHVGHTHHLAPEQRDA